MEMGTGSKLWCILRTAGPCTTKLAASLSAAGIAAWTPSLVAKRRLPRRKATIERTAPIMPTFVFVPADRLPDLIAILARPSNPHPQFSIFPNACRTGPARIGAGQMASLRQVEEQAAEAYRREKERQRNKALRASAQAIPLGTQVRVPQTAFAGLMGVVEGHEGRNMRVNMGGGFIVKIEAWLLKADQVEMGSL
ncbi:hypothetical protein [Sphingomonas sp. BK069]|uniref:hypothetical protein n=1 Tax=Sphingomonas sp. BK069 TaxID=2586979 RepID=UPI001621D2AE|nr:hypothetical protein [Sphingomonas sp. BK069]MBB3347333.1 hypothetical protein [Sphingomonas sp. BK069]